MYKRISDDNYVYVKLDSGQVEKFIQSHKVDGVYSQMEMFDTIPINNIIVRLLVSSRIDKQESVVREVKMYDGESFEPIGSDKPISENIFLEIASKPLKECYELLLRFYSPINSNDKSGDKILITFRSRKEYYLFCSRDFVEKKYPQNVYETLSPTKMFFRKDFSHNI